MKAFIMEEMYMIIGIPKEIMLNENRVSATPQTVKKYINDGYKVLVEKGAGEGSHFYDEEYLENGATIIENVEELYQQADLILKVKEPLFNEKTGKHEIDMMKRGQYLITFIHPASPVNHDMVKHMAERGIIGLTLDSVPRISRAQSMDALTSMSTCAGYKGMIMAINSLTKFAPQIFSAVGMIKPINALVVGVGVAGLQAIATAKRLGAVVYAIDIRPDAVEQAKSLGAKIVEFDVPRELAVGKGGYAQSLPVNLIEKEKEVIAKVLPDMDVVFLSALVPGHIAPILISEDMVKTMKPGSVIVDISIDQGGNCEITPSGKVEVKHNVTINGIKNIPGHLSTSSTWMFANNVYNLVKYLAKDGEIKLDLDDEITSSMLVTDGYKIVHEGLLEVLNKK